MRIIKVKFGGGIALKKYKFAALFVVMFVLLSGCSVLGSPSSEKNEGRQTFQVMPSYLKADGLAKADLLGGEDNAALAGDTTPQSSASSKGDTLKSLEWSYKNRNSATGLGHDFSKDQQAAVSAENMPLKDFIHYTFSELLGVNYVLDPSFNSESVDKQSKVTLSITNTLSSQELFDIVNRLLVERGYNVKYVNSTYVIFRTEGSLSDSQIVLGFGRVESSVPNTSLTILQVVPLKFGIKVSIERILRELTSAKITPDFSQSVIFVQGSRDQILRALDFIDLLDTPSMRGRYIGLVELSFLTPTLFASEVKVLLANEGIDISIGQAINKNVVLVPLAQLGSVAVFATEDFFLKRVRYWASILDVPGEGPVKRYFVYEPKFARALDIDKSLSALLGLQRNSGAPAVSEGSESTGNAPSNYRSSGKSSDELNMVVDEQSNLLIFYASGSRYRDLMPLLKKIDVMPRQVMLDIVIAEVTLKDEFRHGVEWAFSQGEVNVTTQGAFGATSIGGIGLVVNGSKGPIQANLMETNSLVKIISKPTLMARDGIPATISVGSNVSVVGQTTQDPINGDRQTTTSEYRKTGITVSVTSTINGSGTVMMSIEQQISNSVPGSSGAGGNPDIFERSISTDVVSKSGQTVLLGGLISENSSVGGSGTPVLGKIPILGNLFKSESTGGDRTELVMLVTPRVMTDLSEWETLIDDFKEGLQNMGIN